MATYDKVSVLSSSASFQETEGKCMAHAYSLSKIPCTQEFQVSLATEWNFATKKERKKGERKEGRKEGRFDASLGKYFLRPFIEKPHHKKGVVEWLKW
jgi:hypothetical protein